MTTHWPETGRLLMTSVREHEIQVCIYEVPSGAVGLHLEDAVRR